MVADGPRVHSSSGRRGEARAPILPFAGRSTKINSQSHCPRAAETEKEGLRVELTDLLAKQAAGVTMTPPMLVIE